MDLDRLSQEPGRPPEPIASQVARRHLATPREESGAGVCATSGSSTRMGVSGKLRVSARQVPSAHRGRPSASPRTPPPESLALAPRSAPRAGRARSAGCRQRRADGVLRHGLVRPAFHPPSARSGDASEGRTETSRRSVCVPLPSGVQHPKPALRLLDQHREGDRRLGIGAHAGPHPQGIRVFIVPVPHEMNAGRHRDPCRPLCGGAETCDDGRDTHGHGARPVIGRRRCTHAWPRWDGAALL
jgi:hypothetical protein